MMYQMLPMKESERKYTFNQSHQIEMQTGLPNIVENCYVVNNSQFVITRWNATAGAAEILGSDQWHWNQADALAIGESVGRLIVEELLTSEETPVPSVEADAK
jgi:hypothetical protein